MQQIDLRGAVGRMVTSVLFGIAEIELEYRRERQAAGIRVARCRGVYLGRMKGTTKASPARVLELRDRGLTAAEIATALDDAHEILLRLGKNGLKMHKRLADLGLPLTTVCRTVKDAAMSDELPGLEGSPWAEFPGRPAMMRALQARAKAWDGAAEAARRKILLKAITAGLTPLPSEPAPKRAAPVPFNPPTMHERAQLHEERVVAAPDPRDIQGLNLALLNGAIGALSNDELSSDEAIRGRLDARQARLLEHGLHAPSAALIG